MMLRYAELPTSNGMTSELSNWCKFIPCRQTSQISMRKFCMELLPQALLLKLLTAILIWSLLISPSFGKKNPVSGRQTPQYLSHDHSFVLDEGETIQIHFKSKLKSPSDLLSRDFHIITVQLPTTDLSSPTPPVDIHLQRNHGVVHPSVIKEGNHAVFRGDFYPNGNVAFTATLHDLGFSGHIIQGDNHFYLEPVFDTFTEISSPFKFLRRRRRESDNNLTTVSLPHNFYKMEKLLAHDNQTHADVAHVPRDELEKAIKEMDDQEKMFRNSTDDQEKMFRNSTAPPTNPTEPTDAQVGDQVVIENTRIESDASASQLGETFAFPKNKNRGNKNSQKSVNNKPNRNKAVGGWKKRGPTPKASPPTASNIGSEPKIIEIAVFADPQLTTSWEAKYPKDGKTKMRTFILNLINNMDLLYKQPSLGTPVSISLVHLEFLSASSTPDPFGGEATKYLKSFCKYAGNKNEKGAQWDHALLLTGQNLQEAGDSSVAGMAWFSTMCLKYWSCSVSEGNSFSTSFILTHELGHSLGMEHDGSGVSKGCASNKFIMSPTTGKGKTSWSTCSGANLKDFIAKGSPEVGKKDLASIPTCLTRASPLRNQQIRFSRKGSGSAEDGGKLPGEIYNLTNQCELDCGKDCRHHKLKNDEEVCGMLWCAKNSSSASQSVVVNEAHPALEGSFCGTGKFCRYGKCVKNPTA